MRAGKASALKEHVLACDHPGCRASVKLDRAGARLKWGKGRHCEIAVVAAAGVTGMHSSEIVPARRAYAKHLSVKLGGSVSDADDPRHIEHALDPRAKWPINLGGARAVKLESRYVIRLDDSSREG
jgi:hypothetical protein